MRSLYRCRITAVGVALALTSLAASAPRALAAESAATLRARGLELGYNLDHLEALSTFKEAIAADPADPSAYRLAAATTWIHLLFDQGAITVDDYLGQARANLPRAAPDTELAARFHDFIRQSIDLSEARLRKDSSDAEAHYQAGAAYGMLASYTATIEGRLLGSFTPARRAYREHERTLELDATRKDANLIVGMYRYAVSGLRAPMRLLARLAGFGGDGDRAFHMVEEAGNYPSDAQPNALFTLILMYNREERYDDALRVIGELKQRFPRNRLLWLEAGNTALRAGRPLAAKTSIEEGLSRLSRDSRPRAAGEEARWRYAYGASLVALKERVPAERELRVALAAATRDWVRGRVHRELGKLADLSGERARALDEYRLADRLCRADRDGDCADEVKTLMKKAYR